ncbi:MAG: hypothetical protein GX849_04015 [Clostridiaceae bacterium]|nr:hypothetical protein [Clostridiaceae bacterium]
MKKVLAILLVLVMALGLLTACGDKKPDPPPAGGRTSLVLAESSEWWGMDTTLLDGASFTQGLVAESLVTLDSDGNMTPGIASAVSMSDDGKTIQLTIPKGMFYASGEEVEPEDVVASLTRFKEVSPFSTNLEPLVSMEIKDRDVFLYLAEYTSDIGVSLSGSFITVQDKDVLDKSSDDDLLWGAQPYGLYYLDSYVSGSHVELKRNPGFKTHNPYVKNQGPAAVESVTVRFITEEFSMANALNVDDIQVILGISADGLSQVTRKDIEVKQLVTNHNIDYLEFNLKSDILADPLVREALALAIDRDALVDINKGLVIPAYSIVTDKVISHSEAFADYYKSNYGTNIEKAKELLAQAGWADSDGNGYLDKDGKELKLKIVANDDAVENNTVQSLQIQYKEIGVNLDIEMFATYYHYDVIADGNYDIGLEHFGWPEPILLMNMITCDLENLKTAGREDEYYGLIADASHTPDNDERTKIIYDAEMILAQHMITVPLYTGMNTYVFADGVTGIDIRGNGDIFFNDMN